MALPMLDTPEVTPRPVSAVPIEVRATPESYGGAVGVGLEQLGQNLGHIAIKERMLAAEFTADSRDLAFAREAGDVFANFRKQQGENALNAAPVIDKIDSIREKYAGDLNDPLAQRLYHSASRRRAENLVQMVEMHSAVERDRFYANTDQGLRDDAVDKMRNAYASPEAISRAAEEYIPKQVRYLRDVRGLSSGQVNAEVRKFVQIGVNAALGQAVAAQTPEGVQAGIGLINSNLKLGDSEYSVRSVLGKDVEIWESRLKKSVALETGKQVGASVFLSNYDPVRRKVKDDQEALNQIYAQFGTKGEDGKVTVTDPDGLAHAIATYNSLSGVQQQANDAHTGTQVGTLLQMINSGAPLSQVKSAPEWKDLLDTDWPNKLQAYYEHKNKLDDPNERRLASARTPAESLALAQFYDGPKQRYLGPDGAKLFVNDWAGKMHPTDLERELIRVGASPKNDPPWAHRALSDAMGQVMIRLDKKNPPDPKHVDDYNEDEIAAYGKVQEGMIQFLRRWSEEHHGQPPPKAEVQKELDQYMQEVIVPHLWGLYHTKEPKVVNEARQQREGDASQGEQTWHVKRNGVYGDIPPGEFDPKTDVRVDATGKEIK